MKELIIGLDGSLRSSGICVCDLDGNLVSFKVIAPSTTKYKDEDLLVYIRDELRGYLQAVSSMGSIKKLYYERAAFAANSGVKDKISGSYWLNRIMLKEEGIDWDLVSVTEWRKEIITKHDRDEWKKLQLTSKQKNEMLKQLPINRLPKDVRFAFDHYITNNKLSKSLDDLSDAYWITQWAIKNKK